MVPTGRRSAPPDDKLRTRPQMCNCTSGNPWIPGLSLSRCPGMTSIINPDRPDLDRTKPGTGNACGNRERGVEILGLYQIIASELLAGFRERTIRRHCLAVANAHRGRGRGRLQPVAGLEIT